MSVTAIMDNLLTPFMLEGAQVRGRIVRLGSVAHTVLSRYDYPQPVAELIGQLLVVASMLGANLKREGIITIQIRGKGLVPLVVVDAVYGGALRGFAEVPPESVAAIAALPKPTPADLVGADAYLAITYDPGEGMQRYQGVVALEGDSVASALSAYFTNSQQIDAEVKLALGKANGAWVAAGMLIERMPDVAADADREPWRYAQAILGTVTTTELLDAMLDAPALLYRLFHEQGVWVYDAHPLSTGCRCSRDRITDLLLSMPLVDRADMVVDGKISVHCQFCNKTEILTPADVGLSVN